MGLKGFVANVLEAIIINKEVCFFNVDYLSGHSRKTCAQAICILYKHALIERNAGFYFATEKGKIVLALTRGKQHHRAARRKSA